MLSGGMSLRPWRRRSPPALVIWSAQETSLSSAGVATAREPERPIAASRFSCRSVGRRSLARHTPSLRRGDVSSDGLPRQPGPQCYVPLAAPRLPPADDFRYLHSQHLLIDRMTALVAKRTNLAGHHAFYCLKSGPMKAKVILHGRAGRPPMGGLVEVNRGRQRALTLGGFEGVGAGGW